MPQYKRVLKVLLVSILQPATEFDGNRFGRFCPILLRQTKKQTNRTVNVAAINIIHEECINVNVLHPSGNI